jgi:glycosyltransferase involved in cell wall biosynthesis
MEEPYGPPRRVLHLIEPGDASGNCGPCTLRMIASALARTGCAKGAERGAGAMQHETLVIGTARDAALAGRCGLSPIGSISAPRALPLLARKALRRFVELHLPPGAVVHAWSPRAAALAALAAPRRRRIATFMAGPGSASDAALLRRLLEHRPMPVMLGSADAVRLWRALALPERSSAAIAPGVDPQAIDSGARAERRKRWGVDDGAFVIGLLAEPAGRGDARRAAEIAARLHLMDRRVRLIMHPSAHRRLQAARWCRDAGLASLLVFDDDLAEPWRALAALDAAITTASDAPSLERSGSRGMPWLSALGTARPPAIASSAPIAWAMAAGVPVVAAASDSAREFIGDGADGFLVGAADINAACERLMRLYDDRPLAARIGAAGQRRVAERFSIEAFCERMVAAWRA